MTGSRASGASAGPSSSGRRALGVGSASHAGGQLWVEKHKPSNSSELVGNNTLVSTLRTFLQDWYASLSNVLPAACQAAHWGPLDFDADAIQYAVMIHGLFVKHKSTG